MLMILKRMYELAQKMISTKGLVFFTMLITVLAGKLDGMYLFLSGLVLISARLFEKFINKDKPKEL